MLNRRDVFGTVREKSAQDEVELLEKGHRVDMAVADDATPTGDAALSVRDQRAIALLVVLCKLSCRVGECWPACSC